MEEIYKLIVGYEGNYDVSDFGNVRNCKTGRIMKRCKNGDGYLQVGLRKDKKRKMFRINRLVALAFLENPENKPQVDHIDRNKQNNRLDNLRWATNSENTINSGLQSTNTSGVKGVQFNKSKNKFEARISINGERTHLGTFATKEEAIAVRRKAELEIYGHYLEY